MQGFVEVVIVVSLDRTQILANITQTKRKQYGMKPHVTITISEAMEDTLQTTATKISLSKRNKKYGKKNN